MTAARAVQVVPAVGNRRSKPTARC